MPANFRTQFEKAPSISTEPGSRTKVMYGPKYDKQGRMYLVETGVHDLYAEIQSHADSVDIHVLLERFAQGDPGALTRIQGTYGDFTQLPGSFAEALNIMAAAEQYFMSLPVDVRDRFGQDFNQFIAAMDTPDWVSKVGLDHAPTPDPNAIVSPAASQAPQASSAPSSVSPATPSSTPSQAPSVAS